MYVLPPADDLVDIPGKLYIGPSEQQKVQAFLIKKGEFAVFDTSPGQFFIDYETSDVYYYDEYKNFYTLR